MTGIAALTIVAAVGDGLRSSRTSGAVVGVVAAMVLLANPASSLAVDSAHLQHCGAVSGTFALELTAMGVSCPVARHFVRGITANRVELDVRSTRYLGYDCRPHQVGAAAWMIRCAQGQRVIRWLNGT